MEILNIIIVILTGLFSAFYGTISGGGALITIPVLIFVGLPFQVAIATNRFSAIGITSAGLYRYAKGKKVLFKLAFFLTPFTVVGSLIGANFLLKIEENILEKLIAFLLISIALLLIFKKDVGLKRKIITRISNKRKILGAIFAFLLGIYLGFFGAAWATFFIYFLIFYFGLTFLESAGTIKVINLFSSIIATAIFLIHGKVNFLYGGLFLVSRAVGSYLGASFALRRGESFAKILSIVVALIFGIKLLIG